MAFRRTGLLLALALFWLAGCARQTPPPAVIEAPTQAAPSPAPSATATPAASLTATATLAPSATVTRTFTPAPSLTATQAVAFEQLKVLALENRVGGWMLTLAVPGAEKPLSLTLGGNRYDCSVDAQYPGRLFCQGLAKPPFDAQLSLTFSDPQSGAVVYESTLLIPTALMVRPTPAGWASTGCDRRGQNVSCETECRIDPSGNPCIVATCTDACGPYFSVHTCPDMSLDFASCTPEQWARLKALYQIP